MTVLVRAKVLLHRVCFMTVFLSLRLINLASPRRLLSWVMLFEVTIGWAARVRIPCSRRRPGLRTALLCLMLAMTQWV